MRDAIRRIDLTGTHPLSAYTDGDGVADAIRGLPHWMDAVAAAGPIPSIQTPPAITRIAPIGARLIP